MNQESASDIRLFFRCTLVLFLLILLCGRFGLILHEYFGHGLAAILLGGGIESCRLFYFGGGWVDYVLRSNSFFPNLIVSLAGILIELFTGILLLILRKKISHPLCQTIVTSLAVILIVHGFFYLATGIYYGSGDGAMLYSNSVPIRLTGTAIFFTAACVSAFILSREFSDSLESWLGIKCACSPFLTFAGAAVLASMLHLGISVIEIKTVPNVRFYQVMRPVYQERIMQELQMEMKKIAEKTPAQSKNQIRSDILKKLRNKHTPFPIEIPLVLMIVLSLGAGYFRRKSENDAPNLVGPRDICIMSVLLLLLLEMIAVLNHAFWQG